jgi:hypothetical protein
VFNATFNNILVYHGGQFYSWRKLYHIMLYEYTGFELTTVLVIGIDGKSNCKSNYHTITTTTVPNVWWYQRDKKKTWKKDRRYNGQMKKSKETNNRQNSTHRSKDWTTGRRERRFSGRWSIPSPLVTLSVSTIYLLDCGTVSMVWYLAVYSDQQILTVKVSDLLLKTQHR